MNINERIEKQFKDKSGSVAKNRLTLQISYAVKLLVEYYHFNDFVIFLDCIEDVAVKTVLNGSEKIWLYQIKTKNGSFTITNVLNEEWLQKLYRHKQQYLGCDFEASLVVNEFIKGENKSPLFANAKSKIETDVCEYDKKGGRTQNLELIKQRISESEGVPLAAIDLSDFYFIKTDLHLNTHKDQALKIISDFIEDIDPSAEAAKIRAFFNALYGELDDRFNYELEPRNSDYDEIQTKKGFVKKEFERAIEIYLNGAIPKPSELFSILGITNAKEQKDIASRRSQFLMDSTRQDSTFKVLLSVIDEYIVNSDTNKFLDDGIDFIQDSGRVSPIYTDVPYMKYALLHRYKMFLDGRVG